MIHLKDLAKGERFKIPSLGKTGIILHQGDMATLVRYDGSITREVNGKAFQAPYLPVLISSGTEIEPLTAEEAAHLGTEVAVDGKRKRGRPKGSKNKVNRKHRVGEFWE